MKGKVCLINANLMRPPIGPIGLDYLADALAAAGYAPEVLDLALAADPEAALRGYFAAGEPLAVGLTIRNTDDCYFPSGDFLLPEVRRLIGLLREVTSAPIVAGGVGFSTNPEAALEYLGLELGIRGDGEHALPRLLSELAGDRELERVPNLVWSRGERVIRNRAAYPSLKNTAHSRAFVDNITYFRLGGMGGIETKRGCPGRCAYCADPVAQGRRSRPRHPGLVADEVERLQQAIGRDERFFLGLREESEANYNYNDNEVLERAIAGGMRGAYWDILRRLAEG